MRVVLTLGVVLVLGCAPGEGGRLQIEDGECGLPGGHRSAVHCKDGLFCDYSRHSDPDLGRCAQRPGLNEPCFPNGGNQCGEPELGIGEDCDGGCPSNLICNGSMNPRVCTPPIEEGADCQYGQDCAEGLTCLAEGMEFDCATGHQPTGGRCVTLLGLGAACRCGHECLSRVCKQPAGAAGCACAESDESGRGREACSLR